MAEQEPTRVGPTTEKHGLYPGYEAMKAALPQGHPMRFVETENLFWYDGPVVSIGVVPEDERPRLDVLAGGGHEGEDGTRVFTDVRHQLVFADRSALDAGLHRGYAPTRRNYADAVEILRYTSVVTQVGHASPCAHVTSGPVTMADIEDEMPDADLLPEPAKEDDKP